VSSILTEHIALLDRSGCIVWSRSLPFNSWRRQVSHEPPIAALKSLLSDAHGRLTVYLSSNLAYPVSLPWVDGLKNRADWQRYALHVLSERYGRPPDSWHVCWNLPSYGQAALAAGMDRSLWSQLNALPPRLGPVRPLLPYLMAQRSRTLDGNQTLLLLERETLSWAGRHTAQWGEVGVVPRPEGHSITELLETLHALGMNDPHPCFLVADPDCSTLPVQAVGWALPMLDPAS